MQSAGFCLLSLVACEVVRDDVAVDVGNKMDFPGLCCESGGDCQVQGQSS